METEGFEYQRVILACGDGHRTDHRRRIQCRCYLEVVSVQIYRVSGGLRADCVVFRIFWIVLPINGIAIFLVAIFLDIPLTLANDTQIDAEKAPELVGKKSVHKLSWKQMDYVGAALLVASLSSFLIPITWGGIQYSWSSYHTMVPLILGVAGIIAWLVYEGFVPTNPIMPLSILSDRTVAIAFASTFVTGLCQYGVVFYLPLYYQIVKGYSPLISGLGLLPSTLAGAPSNMATGIIISKTGKYKFMLLIGWSLLALGMGLLVILGPHTSVPAWIFIGIPGGLGFGVVLPALTVASTAPVKQEHMALASGLSPYTRAIGQAIGIAVGNSMVQNLLKNNLASSGAEVLRQNAELIAQNVASPDLLRMFTSDASTKADLLEAYTHAIRGFWWLLCALSLLCGLMSFFIRDVSLDRAQVEEIGEKKMESTDSSAAASVIENANYANSARQEHSQLRESWCER